MTECRYIEKVDAYCDAELPAAEEREMAAHVGTCAACTARVRETEALGRLIAGAEGAGLSQIAAARLHHAVTYAWEQGAVRWAWGVTGVAAAVLVGASVWVATMTAPQAGGNPAGAGPGIGWEQAAATGGADLQAGQAYANADDVRYATWVVSDLSGNDQQERQ